MAIYNSPADRENQRAILEAYVRLTGALMYEQYHSEVAALDAFVVAKTGETNHVEVKHRRYTYDDLRSRPGGLRIEATKIDAADWLWELQRSKTYVVVEFDCGTIIEIEVPPGDTLEFGEVPDPRRGTTQHVTHLPWDLARVIRKAPAPKRAPDRSASRQRGAHGPQTSKAR